MIRFPTEVKKEVLGQAQGEMKKFRGRLSCPCGYSSGSECDVTSNTALSYNGDNDIVYNRYDVNEKFCRAFFTSVGYINGALGSVYPRP
jgi:hypothetical protein